MKITLIHIFKFGNGFSPVGELGPVHQMRLAAPRRLTPHHLSRICLDFSSLPTQHTRFLIKQHLAAMGLTQSHHLQVFNPPRGPPVKFHQFSQLPLEIRELIWECSLTWERIFRVELEDRPKAQYVDESRPDFDLTRLPYTVVVRGCNTIPKFFRVSRESRRIAKRFYRIKIPVQFDRKDEQGQADSVFYFNPELDIIWLNLSCFGAYKFINFVNFLRVADPQQVGLRNLCMSESDLYSFGDVDRHEIDSERWEGFTAVLADLRHVYFLCVSRGGRVFMGPHNPSAIIKGWEVHRSRPLWSMIPTFDRLPRDPRPIHRDLQKVSFEGSDPRTAALKWKRYLDDWDVEAGSEVEHGYIVTTYSDYSNVVKIRDRSDAKTWLGAEDLNWRQHQSFHKDKIESAIGRPLPVERLEDLQQAPPNAVGFWIFPVEACGEVSPRLLDEHDEAGPRLERNRVLDLTKYPPQLCLSSMP
jgi:hypothetical protein